MELTMSMFATQADYWKARAELAEKRLAELRPKEKQMQIKAGDKLKDNDPRMVGRELVVLEVGDTRVQCQHAKYPSFPKVWIRIDRIHTDGKPRRSGFDLVTPNAGIHRPRSGPVE